MIRITHQREKCIGCNYCVELAFERWRISKKDGKVTLIDGINKKGFYTTLTGDDEYEANLNAAKVCPVKIIRVEKVK
ncbi:MAG: ferredoxin [Flavobacteriales bacterium CG_4_9_14_3_um_filter_32_8]|nr:MAG: ferredoxin [Flavobacteriales bacterium CG_4_9_14_3_um_filter_32_8]